LIEIEPMPSGRTTVRPATVSRLTERHVLSLGLGVSGMFVLAAGIAAMVTISSGGSPWVALHLALVGAATVAIGTFMPHFAVTLAGTRPAPAVERFAAIALLAVGAVGVVSGMSILGSGWTVAGAALALVGLGLTARHTVAPTRDPLARRHPIALLAYALALGELATAMVIGAAGAAGVPAVTSAWATLRPAHAWLSLFGAVSLTIFATLVYLAPTVLGARLRPSVPLAVGLVGVASGPLLTAAGFALGLGPLVISGMAVTLVGALGQVAYSLDAYRRRGPFTTEHDWRRVVIWHLVGGTAWFAAACAVALAGMVGGTAVAGWSIGALAVPLVAGWLLQELVGSWTHLVPSVTPGSPADHAAQRRALAVGSRSRLVAWNAGIGLAWAGLVLDAVTVAGVGALLVGAALAVSVASLATALTRARY
jgi:nitrite reductase (NO-forming)